MLWKLIDSNMPLDEVLFFDTGMEFDAIYDERNKMLPVLALCYKRGNEWLDHGVRLYDVLDRASCWLCRNKNMRELKAIHEHLPVYWERLIALEGVCGQMKSRPLSEIAGA